MKCNSRSSLKWNKHQQKKRHSNVFDLQPCEMDFPHHTNFCYMINSEPAVIHTINDMDVIWQQQTYTRLKYITVLKNITEITIQK